MKALPLEGFFFSASSRLAPIRKALVDVGYTCSCSVLLMFSKQDSSSPKETALK